MTAGRRSFGVLHLANAVGGSIGPWTAGRIFDGTGSYRLAVLGIGGLLDRGRPAGCPRIE